MLARGRAAAIPRGGDQRRAEYPSFAGGDTPPGAGVRWPMALSAPESTLEGHRGAGRRASRPGAARGGGRAHLPRGPQRRLLLLGDRPGDDAGDGRGRHQEPAVRDVPARTGTTSSWSRTTSSSPTSRRARPVADLHDATGGRPERSPRWREFGGYTGFRSEVRMAFTVDGATWGVGQLNRLGDASRFSDEEKAWLERAIPAVGAGLRKALLAPPASAAADRGPGLVLLDADGSVVSVNREAAAWLDELRGGPAFAGKDHAVPFEAFSLRRARPGRRARAAGHRARAGAHPRRRMAHDARLGARGHRPARGDHRARQGGRRRPADRRGLWAHRRELDVTRRIARGMGTSRDRRRALPLTAHGARPREGDLREGRREEPRRARGHGLRRPLRPAGPLRGPN